MATKLHEILAVEGTKEKAAKKLIKESLVTLNKDTLFKGQTRRLEMIKEDDKHLETVENQELTTTVNENLDYLQGPISGWLDVVFAKEKGNQNAVADLIVGGKKILSAAPATFLLGLEKKLIELRSIYDAIPTLAPGIKWVADENEREGVYVAYNAVTSFKTKKDIEFRVAHEATKEHPAQVAQLQTEVNVGKYTTISKSGMVAPIEKANRLKRLDDVLAAVKQARMRANNIDVDTAPACHRILEYINKGS